MLTDTERRLRARLAAYSQHAQGKTNTGPALAAYNARWEREVDPDGVLPPEERARRAELARKAHYTSMAFKSARARARRAGQARRGGHARGHSRPAEGRPQAGHDRVIQGPDGLDLGVEER